MKLIQITPGAGGMYCGNCFRDNALVAEWRALGDEALMIPLYLPMTLDEENQSAGVPIFFSGINVYLEQKIPWFRHSPKWLHDLLASPKLLKWASGRAAKTRAADVGDLTVSMLKGEQGHQARELDCLLDWLQHHERPDVICLSNGMLLGLARKLRQGLKVPVACMLQGEDTFLDELPAAYRQQAWEVLAERAREVDLLLAPSRYFARHMAKRIGLPEDRIQVVPNGISLEGYSESSQLPDPPVIGYFARMCREKGVDRIVSDFIQLKKRNRIPGVKLKIGGGMGPSDVPLVNQLKGKLLKEGLDQEVSWHPNLDRNEKQAFFQTLTLFSVPALYGEAFGLYLAEAMASGVPVLQPHHAAFPEIIERTQGGHLYDAENPTAWVEACENLLLNRPLLQQLASTARDSARREFSVTAMAKHMRCHLSRLVQPAEPQPISS